jgi:hypothetical protein
MKRIILATVFAAGMALSIPLSAFADDCHNLSRPAPANAEQMTVLGNWVWVPAGAFGDGQPAQGAWYFAVPGGFVATQIIGTPDANGNYTNGKTDMLLGPSANCDPSKTNSRQTSQGIQNECTLGVP